MAQSGYTPILLYASATASDVPVAANLTSTPTGVELALNYTDGKLYYKDNNGVVQVLASKIGSAGITTLGVVTAGTWNATVIGSTYGGTGVNNGSNTLTLAGSVTHAGAYTQSFTATGTTAVTLPTSGTLMSSVTALSGAVTGTPSSSNFLRGDGTWNNISLTTNVSGTLPIANGGTGVTTTPVNGALLIGNGTGYTSSTLTAGSGITITNSAGGISISNGSPSSGGTVTSVSFTGGIISVATATSTPALTVAGTSGGVPYFSSASTWASSGVLAQYGVVLGGGAGASPTTLTNGTTNQVLLANTSASPSWGQVSLTASVTGTLPVANGGTGATTLTANNVLLGNGTSAPLTVAPGTSGNVLTSNGTTWVSSAATGGVTSLTGTANQISVSASTGAITLSTPQSIGTGSNVQFNSIGVGTAASVTSGTIQATGNITAYYSDDNLKTRLGVIEDALSKVRRLSGFYYEANETAQALGYKKIREVGVSAQAIQKELPEIVHPAPIDNKYLTVDYERITPLLIEAIKELANQVDAIKAKL